MCQHPVALVDPVGHVAHAAHAAHAAHVAHAAPAVLVDPVVPVALAAPVALVGPPVPVVLVVLVALVDPPVPVDPVDPVIPVSQAAPMSHLNVVPVFRVHPHLGIRFVVLVVHVVLKYPVLLVGHAAVTAAHPVSVYLNCTYISLYSFIIQHSFPKVAVHGCRLFG